MKFFQIFILLCPIMLFSQNDVDNLSVIESELAKKILSQKINLNTLNYDLKYHKLDLNLDPDLKFMSRPCPTITTKFSTQ